MGYDKYYSVCSLADDGSKSYSRGGASAKNTAFYASASVDQIFTQQKKREAHESMLPKNAKLRECRDSTTHPNAFPVILTLDVTGSMRRIPHDLIKTGLPTLMGGLVDKGASDTSLLFLAVGDHEVDRFPLQVGQFESGDAELDMWLTRTYLEGGGGHGYNESYQLAWEFAGEHTASDAWDKRKQKGVLVTIGDEFVHPNLSKSALTGIYGESGLQESLVTKEQLLAKAQERYEVYHLHVMHTDAAKRAFEQWKDVLGQNVIPVDDFKKIPNIVQDLVLAHAKPDAVRTENVKIEVRPSEKEEVEML